MKKITPMGKLRTQNKEYFVIHMFRRTEGIFTVVDPYTISAVDPGQMISTALYEKPFDLEVVGDWALELRDVKEIYVNEGE